MYLLTKGLFIKVNHISHYLYETPKPFNLIGMFKKERLLACCLVGKLSSAFILKSQHCSACITSTIIQYQSPKQITVSCSVSKCLKYDPLTDRVIGINSLTGRYVVINTNAAKRITTSTTARLVHWVCELKT